MDSRALRVLEYDAILEILAGHAASSLGHERALSLVPTADRREVQTSLDETSEARALLDQPGGIPLGGIHDVRPVIERAAVGALLDPRDLLAVASTFGAARRLRTILNGRTGMRPLLADLGAQMADFSALVTRIEASITPDGQVTDGASDALRSIRAAKRRQIRAIQDILQRLISNTSTRELLQDPVITVRNGRYCLPVKSECRSAFGGLVQDQSASGQTVFMEPQAVVDAGNELRQIEFREREEIERILRGFSDTIAREAKAARATVNALAHLDLVTAKARFANALRAEAPSLLPDVALDLKEARHPLLVWNAVEAQRTAARGSASPGPDEAVVPIDLWLGTDFQTLLITGPNTGVKTVTLKTAGLFVLMAQSGMHLPCRSAKMGVFNNVFADIGDEQSIQQSLSTFSGHINNIVRILAGASNGALVLLDEMGAGTDPAEGAALAKAILLRLHERGALTIATTHYAELKEFAWERPGFQNSSVEFDVETLRPTYRLRIGVPGASNALTIAGRLGMPADVLDTARAHMGTDRMALEDAIGRMEETERRARWAAVESEKQSQALEAQRRDAERELSETKDRRREATERAYEEALELLRDAREEANALIRALREEQAESKSSTAARDRLRQMEETLRQKRPRQRRKPTHRIAADVAPAPGNAVWVPSLGATGKLIEVRRDSAIVQAGALRMTVPYSTLQKVAEEPVEQARPAAISRSLSVESAASVSTEVHLRHMRMDEALDALDRYMDQARLAGLHTVRIVHGKGTGALRTMVHRYLKEQPDVKGFRLGEDGEGGFGVTVAELA
jgi:DNA mismatch repair protein MutS2